MAAAVFYRFLSLMTACQRYPVVMYRVGAPVEQSNIGILRSKREGHRAGVVDIQRKLYVAEW